MTAEDVVAGVGKLAKLYRNDVGPDTLVFYAEILLGNLTPGEACAAIAKWAARETRWPSPAHLIELIKPRQEARDEALELSQRLLALIQRRGYTWESTCRYDGHATADDGVRAELGDVAVSVVRRCGGWAAFCKDWGGAESLGTARAQLRDLCAAIGVSVARDGIIALPPKNTDAIGEFIAQQKALRARKTSEE